MTLLLYSHASGLDHDTGPGHPERRARLESLLAGVAEADIAGLERREAPSAGLGQIRRVHPGGYAESLLASVPETGFVPLDPDTILSPGSGEAALHAAGAACAAVDAVLAGEASRAFCAMRPPGHHAEPGRAMGFCLLNNVAIAAMQARAVHGLGRIAILDFDVHHGNGTQAAFWSDPLTLYVSTHQHPLFPGTGAAAERGVAGNILNLPLPAGTGSAAYRQVVEERVVPAIDAFAPELVLLSAGFDAHRADPLGSMRLVEDDFAWITRQAVGLAERHANGRVVSVLEGGYDELALTRSTVAHLRALAEA